jgi:uncharacterized protein YuzE
LLPRPAGELAAKQTEGAFLSGGAMLEANTPSALRAPPPWDGGGNAWYDSLRKTQKESATKWIYEPEADAAHMVLEDVAIHESEEVTPGVIFDFDDGGRIVGIEVLNASTRLPKSALVPEAP